MTTIAPAYEYRHLSPEGHVCVEATSDYCARIIGDGFADAYFKLNTPFVIWHNSLSTFLSSIIIGSQRGLATTAAALMLIREYQVALENIGACVVDEVEDVMLLWVVACMIADSELDDDEPLHLTQWSDITCGEYTIQDLGQKEYDFRQTLDHFTKIDPDTLTEMQYALIEGQNEVLEENEEIYEKEMAWMADDTYSTHTSTSSRRPLRVMNMCSGERLSTSTDSSSKSLRLVGFSNCERIQTYSAALDEEDEALFSEARYIS